MRTPALDDAAECAARGITYLTPGPTPASMWTGDVASPLLLRLDGKVTPAMRKAESRARDIMAALRMGGEVTFTDGAYRRDVTVTLPAIPATRDGSPPDRWAPGRPGQISVAYRIAVPFDIQKPLDITRLWQATEIPAPAPKTARKPRRRELVNA